MNISTVNFELNKWSLDILETRSFRHERSLTISFYADGGGEKESEYYIVEFDEVIIMNIPSILYSECRFELVPESEVADYIPKISYDPGEFGTEGYKVFRLVYLNHKYIGYFIVAMSINGKWVNYQDVNRLFK